MLQKIAAARKIRVEEAKKRVSEAELRKIAASRPPALDALGLLGKFPAWKRAVIAEVKRRSPSKGEIAPGIDAGKVAASYERAGAFAISCLTEPDFFGGSLGDLDAVRGAVRIPVLYKDFVIDPYQFAEGRAHGADLVLLIVALLGEETEKYLELAHAAGLTALVEVHDEEELSTALKTSARLIGVNSRNLKTFKVDIEEGAKLISTIPKDRFAVAESGIKSVADMEMLESAGARAFLIGESVVKESDPERALRALVERSA
ncbi:indole-3-glycerol phosphate synthase TrpC [bacterium]|nr:MAG: indole-3-glycerol phosphate synthase TrpC [bacterium]